MRKTIVIAAILLGCVALVVLLATSTPTPSPPPDEPESSSEAALPPPPGSVSGRVLRSDGLPAPGALVRAGEVEVKVNASGEYVLPGLPAGPGRLDASAPGLVSPGPAAERGARVEVDPNAALTGVDLILREPAQVRGRVLAGGKPLAGATLGLFYLHADGVDGRPLQPFALDAIATSGADGRFDTGPVAPGRLRVLVEAQGFALLESRQLMLREGQVWPNLTLDLAPSAALTVQLVDKDGTPVRAEVTLSGASLPRSRQLKAPASGELRFDALPPGELVVTASAPGYRRARVPTTIEVGEGNQVDVILEPASGVFGRVVDAKGAPIRGASLLLRRSDQRRPKFLRTDATGTFSWDDAPEGTWSADVTSTRHTSALDVAVKSGEEAVVRLGEGGRIVGSVVTSSGAPVQSFSLAVEEFQGDRPWMAQTRSYPRPSISRADGAFDYGPLRPGTYFIRVSPRAFGGKVVGPVRVTAGAQAGPLRVVVEAAGTVRGVVRSSKDGAPVAGASVEVFEPMSRLPRRRTRTRKDGSFELASVSPGRRSVRVTQRGFLTQVVAGVEVTSEKTTSRDITLEPAAPGARFAFHGIGATLGKSERGVIIRDIMDGSPSQSFGLEKGDVIVSVDGKDSNDMRFVDVINKIRGEEGVPVAIEVLREGQGRMTIDVERGRVVVKDRRQPPPPKK